jgi:hypothetical protein
MCVLQAVLGSVLSCGKNTQLAYCHVVGALESHYSSGVMQQYCSDLSSLSSADNLVHLVSLLSNKRAPARCRAICGLCGDPDLLDATGESGQCQLCSVNCCTLCVHETQAGAALRLSRMCRCVSAPAPAALRVLLGVMLKCYMLHVSGRHLSALFWSVNQRDMPSLVAAVSYCSNAFCSAQLPELRQCLLDIQP